MAKLVIKRGKQIVVDTDRSTLIDAAQTYDGMVFNFRNGFILNYTDATFPNSSKNLIVSTLNNFEAADIEVDLINYQKPVFAKI